MKLGWVLSSLLLAFSAALVGCQFGPDQGNPQTPSLFHQSSIFTLRVLYMPGAEPYTGSLSNGMPVWSITEMNMSYILPPSVRDVRVPSSLAEMIPANLPSRAVWSEGELRKIAQREEFSNASLSQKVAIFLRGRYVLPKTLGLHFPNTPVVFIFKTAILDQGGGSNNQRFVEQSALLHEIGHSGGLVNQGVANTTLHEDPSSRHHCTNPKCVMYHGNDGRQAEQSFNLQVQSRGMYTLFGSECLNDFKAHYSN